jgi:hypothetical protein
MNNATESNIIRMIKSRVKGWVGQVTRLGKRRSANRVLVWKCMGNRPSCRFEDNIETDLQRIG